MIPYKGKKAKIVIKGDDGYYLDIDNMEWLWEDLILEDIECIPLSNEEIVEDFLEKVDIDYEEYERHNIGDISYNAIKKLLSDVLYLKEENDKLKNIESRNYSIEVIRENTRLRKENFDLKNSLQKIEEILNDLKEICNEKNNS